MIKGYEAPKLTEWGTVADLTHGLGDTNFTDETECVNQGDVTFSGSAPGRCDPV